MKKDFLKPPFVILTNLYTKMKNVKMKKKLG